EVKQGRRLVMQVALEDVVGGLERVASGHRVSAGVKAGACQSREEVLPVGGRFPYYLRRDRRHRHTRVTQSSELGCRRVVVDAGLLVDQIQRLGQVFLAQQTMRQVANVSSFQGHAGRKLATDGKIQHVGVGRLQSVVHTPGDSESAVVEAGRR